MAVKKYELIQDRKGMVWDLMLYVPTVSALLGLSARFWFGKDPNLAYLLLFLGCFFLIAGANRILKTRLMILPTAPIAIEVDGDQVGFTLRNGKRVEIVKNLRFYPDYSGRTFGLSGMDGSGKQMQFVFHRGQFGDEAAFKAAQTAFRDH